MIKNPARLAGAAALTLALVPTNWMHSADDPIEPVFGADEIAIDSLPPEIAQDLGPFTLVQAWELSSDTHRNHSYSALVIDKSGRMLLASDKGDFLTRSLPHTSDQFADAFFSSLNDGDPDRPDWKRDVEAIVLDEESGSLWLSVENFQSIRRLDLDLNTTGWLQPSAMHDWAASSGGEAMVKLEDGRFLIIPELRENGAHAALLFPSDPVDGVEPVPFAIKMPGDYLPTEMTLLPDGSALILGRDFNLPFKFETVITHLDLVSALKNGGGTAIEIAKITDSALADNYEGMAIELTGELAGGHDETDEAPVSGFSRVSDDVITVWIVSDNNKMQMLQRTILLKLEVRLSDLTRGARF